jgi:hypothetical protein
MIPINFNYVIEKKQFQFPNLEYDYSLNLSRLNGEIFVRTVSSSINTVSKTFSSREIDDESKLIYCMTKTETAREADDDGNKKSQYLNLLMLTKTNTVRETDDEVTNNYKQR